MTNVLQCPTCGRRYPPGTIVCPRDNSTLRADQTIAAVDFSTGGTPLGDAKPAEVTIGTILDGKYRLDAPLGVGGMGTVFRATHLLIDRPVAVKVLNPRLVTDEAARERLRREARAAGRLRHANAVAVTDFGQTDDETIYIVMELLEGVTLRDLLAARDAPLAPEFAVEIMSQCAAAVAAAHEAGIIHRDLKPGNVFILERPHHTPIVKVLDFGIAKVAAPDGETGDLEANNTIEIVGNMTLTETGVMIGTPRYMSPEQCDGMRLTAAADVYSLGVILYEMLTGAPPFTGPTPLSIALKHSTEPPRSLREIVADVPAELEAVVLHALAKRPEERPPDAGEFRRELVGVAEKLGLVRSSGFNLPTSEMRVAEDAGRAPATSENQAPDTIALNQIRQNTEPEPAAASRLMPAPSGATTVVRTSPAANQNVAPQNIATRVVVTLGAGVRRSFDFPRLWREHPAIVAGASAITLVLCALLVFALVRSATGGSSTPSVTAADSSEPRAQVAGSDGGNADVGSATAVLEREPQTANDFYERGGALFDRRDPAGAERDLRRAIELQPEFPEAYNRLGRALVQQGKFSAAITEFRRAIEQRAGDFAIANFNLADALERAGDYRQAIEAYEAAIANRGGNYPEASFEIGRIHFKRNRNDEAAASFRQTIEARGGNDPETHYYLGVALARKRDFEEAEAALRRAIEQRGGNYPEAFYALGVLYENTKRPADAATVYETYLQQQPDATNRRQVENLLRRLRRN